jgi:hypothetical protein
LAPAVGEEPCGVRDEDDLSLKDLAMNEKPEVCPKCRSERVAEIRYGLPDFSEELERELEAGEVVLGGCVVTGGDPSWHCVECGHRWGERGLQPGWSDHG